MIQASGQRAALVGHARLLQARGYVVGADGNLSVRSGGRVLITPSQVPYPRLAPGAIVRVDLDGRGGRNPSSELALHLAVYRARPELTAIVHAHPVHACALAVLREPLPAVLDEVGAVLGGQVEVAEYAPSGTAELGEVAVAALGNRFGVLLANHGTLTVGTSLAQAFHRLEVLERAAHVYLLARLAGSATLPGRPRPASPPRRLVSDPDSASRPTDARPSFRARTRLNPPPNPPPTWGLS